MARKKSKRGHPEVPPLRMRRKLVVLGAARSGIRQRLQVAVSGLTLLLFKMATLCCTCIPFIPGMNGECPSSTSSTPVTIQPGYSWQLSHPVSVYPGGNLIMLSTISLFIIRSQSCLETKNRHSCLRKEMQHSQDISSLFTGV